jgi:hypothetical protein
MYTGHWRSLISLHFIGLLVLCLSLGTLGCDGDEETPTECTALPGQCPNVCTAATGVEGETCDGSSSCDCGLFCSAGVCTRYEGELAGCACGTPSDNPADDAGGDVSSADMGTPDTGPIDMGVVDNCPKPAPAGSPCNPYCQTGCAEDQQCTFSNFFTCAEIGDVGLSGLCAFSGQCEQQMACVGFSGEDAICRKFCITDDDCPDERKCSQTVTFGGGQISATFCSEPAVGCNPFGDSTAECGEGNTCQYKNGSTSCRPVGTLAEDAVCMGVTTDSCGAGLQCLVTCSTICSIDDNTFDRPKCSEACTNGETLVINEENDIGVCLEGTPKKMCELFPQSGCQMNEGCYPTSSLAGFACFTYNGIQPGEACMFTNDCTPGHACLSGSCQQLCDASMGADPSVACDEVCDSSGTLSPAAWGVGFCQDAEPSMPCDFWSQDCMDPTMNCYYVTNGATCLAQTTAGAEGEACGGVTECDRGLLCDFGSSVCVTPCSINELVADTVPKCVDCKDTMGNAVGFTPIGSFANQIGRCNDQ